jgi:hypothetical protein
MGTTNIYLLFAMNHANISLSQSLVNLNTSLPPQKKHFYQQSQLFPSNPDV